MKLIAKAVALATLLVIAAGAFAQGGGGQGRGGFGRMFNNPTMLLGSKDVQTDLNLTDDQKTKINAILAKSREDMQSARENAQASGSGFDPSVFQKIMEDATSQINTILTPDQQNRLKQIAIQNQKNRAILQPEVQDQLGLSQDQKDKIKSLDDAYNAAQGELRQKMRGADDATRQSVRADMQKNTDALDAELGKVLTPDQAAKLKSMGGAPFTGKIEMPRFGGRGGGKGR